MTGIKWTHELKDNREDKADTPLAAESAANESSSAANVLGNDNTLNQVSGPTIMFVNSPGAIGVTGNKNTIHAGPVPRVLTEAQRRTISEGLASCVGHSVSVYADFSDSEAQRYAHQFFTLFKALGLKVGIMVGRAIYTEPKPPISLEVYTAQPIDQTATEVRDAKALQSALIAAGLWGGGAMVLGVLPEHNGGAKEVHLVIGSQ